MIRMDGAAVSHVGAVRKTNQDRAMFSSWLGAVADGMGGHQGGEQAASIVIDQFNSVDSALSPEALVGVVTEANRKVYEASAQPELNGMGTTTVALTYHEDADTVTVVNVGDSRGYRLRNGVFTQITTDHSLVEELVRQGRLDRSEVDTHPQRNVVTRAMGLHDEVDIDRFDLDAVVGDRFLLCSDGLVNELTTEEIAAQLNAADSPEEVAQKLVSLAVESGARDNVSVVVIDLVDDDAETVERPADVMVEEPDFVEPHPTQPLKALWNAEPEAKAERGRMFVLVGAVLAIVLAAYLSVRWYAGDAYFADDRQGEVVIMQGRPGGVLWFDPEVIERTGITLDELNDASVQRLEQRPEWSSREDVDDFVAGLERAQTGAG